MLFLKVRLQIMPIVDDEGAIVDDADAFTEAVEVASAAMTKAWVIDLLDEHGGRAYTIRSGDYKACVTKALAGMEAAGMFCPPTAPGAMPAKYRRGNYWFANILGYSTRKIINSMYTTM